VNSVRVPHVLRPTWMEIDLDRLAHNIAEVRKVIGRDRKLIAVAKGDAYGHGLLGVVPTMVDTGVDIIAVGNLNDAVRLREAGCRVPLLLFGSCLPDAAETIAEYGIIPTVWDVDGARAYSKAARWTLEVYLEVDTGLTRLGVSPDEAAEVAREIDHLPNLHIGCVYSHFADPIKGEEFTLEQYRRFVKTIEAIRDAGIVAPYASMASSDIVSARPEMYLDAVRCGSLIYGFYDSPAPSVVLDLVPIARAVKSRIIQKKWAEVGQSIGARRSFYTRRRTLVGILPFGWGDGLRRSNASRASVLVRSTRCPILGTIYHEHCCIDLTEVEGATVGDEAVLFGEQGKASITLSEHAKWVGISDLEVVSHLGRAIPRVYLKGGQLVAA
jgi:alanine racemase